MKNYTQIAIEVAEEMDGIGGIPTDEEFFHEFKFRLGLKLGISDGLKTCPFCRDAAYIDIIPSKDNSITFFKIHHGPESPCGVSLIDTNMGRLITNWNTR